MNTILPTETRLAPSLEAIILSSQERHVALLGRRFFVGAPRPEGFTEADGSDSVRMLYPIIDRESGGWHRWSTSLESALETAKALNGGAL